MARKRKKVRREPETFTWWSEWTHPEYGDVKVVWTWERAGHPGVYRCVPIAIQFDLFCPRAVQDEMTADVMGTKVGAFFNA